MLKHHLPPRPPGVLGFVSFLRSGSWVYCSLQEFWDWNVGKGLLKIENRYFRGDGGIGAAPRLAAAHRGADTNAPGGNLNQTPGEGVCVSHVAACAVLRLPAPSEAPPDALVPAKGQADRAAAWAHGAAGTRAPGSHLT
jgi:hypothetical protein